MEECGVIYKDLDSLPRPLHTPLPPIFYIVSFINLVVLQQISNKMVEWDT